MKILVVDDTRIILSVIEAILSRDHQEVFTAPDGRAGSEMFYTLLPDMVITDIEMPWRDGLSMMKHIRKTHPNVYTIYMTGNPGPYHQRLMEEQRHYAAGIINKPFTRTELLQAVDDAARQVSTARSPHRPIHPQWSNRMGSDHLAKQSMASLSAASFREERCYAKTDYFDPGSGTFGGIHTGSGR